jgi:hypothetical protein
MKFFLIFITLILHPDSDLDADPDPSIFITDLQDANKKIYIFFLVFLYIPFLKVHKNEIFLNFLT